MAEGSGSTGGGGTTVTSLSPTEAASGQEPSSGGTDALAIAAAQGDDAVNTEASGADSIAIGNSVRATGSETVAIGEDIQTDASAAVVIGRSAESNIGGGVGPVAVGDGASANGDPSTSLGRNASSSADNAAAIGNAATADSGGSIAIGNFAGGSMGSSSVALGTITGASGNSSVAIGANASTSTDGEGVLGTSSDTNAWLIPGDFDVSGNKNFRIPHPLQPETHDLKHGSYEGPVPGGLIYNATVTVNGGSTSLEGDLPDYVTQDAFGSDWTCHVTPSDHFGRAYVDESDWTVHADQDGDYEVTIFGERDDKDALSRGGDRMEKPKGERWDGEPAGYKRDHPNFDPSAHDDVDRLYGQFDHRGAGNAEPNPNAFEEYVVVFADRERVSVDPDDLPTFGPDSGNASGGPPYRAFEADVDEILEAARNDR